MRGDHAEIAQHRIVTDLDGVGAHMRDRSQRVDAADRLDFELVGAQHDPLFAAVDCHRQHQHRRLAGRGHRPDLAADHQRVTLAGGGQRARILRVSRDRRAGSQVREHLGVRVVGGDQRTGDRRRHERAGYRAVAELGEHHRELEDAETLPADRFGQMHTLQALFCRGLPIRRWVVDRCFQRGVQDLRRRHARHQ